MTVFFSGGVLSRDRWRRKQDFCPLFQMFRSGKEQGRSPERSAFFIGFTDNEFGFGCIFENGIEIETIPCEPLSVVRQTEDLPFGIVQKVCRGDGFRQGTFIHTAENDPFCGPEGQIQKTGDLHGIGGMFRIKIDFSGSPGKHLVKFRRLQLRQERRFCKTLQKSREFFRFLPERDPVERRRCFLIDPVEQLPQCPDRIRAAAKSFPDLQDPAESSAQGVRTGVWRLRSKNIHQMFQPVGIQGCVQVIFCGGALCSKPCNETAVCKETADHIDLRLPDQTAEQLQQRHKIQFSGGKTCGVVDFRHTGDIFQFPLDPRNEGGICGGDHGFSAIENVSDRQQFPCKTSQIGGIGGNMDPVSLPLLKVQRVSAPGFRDHSAPRIKTDRHIRGGIDQNINRESTGHFQQFQPFQRGSGQIRHTGDHDPVILPEHGQIAHCVL